MIKHALAAFVFIRLLGFHDLTYRINVDDIRYYTDMFPADPAYGDICEITFKNGNTLQVKHTCDEVDENINNSLRSSK
jgi:hypothetical protein